MSVYIKGFPLPNNCGACPLRLAWCRERIYMVTRPERCPLVPVPEHGRLGDLDDFAKRMKNLVEKAESDGFDLGAAWYSAFVRHIELTPAIILADKEGEG